MCLLHPTAEKREFTCTVRCRCGLFATRSVKPITSSSQYPYSRKVCFEPGKQVLLLVKPKPSQNNSNHVKSSCIKPLNDTVEDSTLHLLKLRCVQFQAVVFWTMGVSLQFLKANQAIEHIHSFSNVFILI